MINSKGSTEISNLFPSNTMLNTAKTSGPIVYRTLIPVGSLFPGDSLLSYYINKSMTAFSRKDIAEHTCGCHPTPQTYETAFFKKY